MRFQRVSQAETTRNNATSRDGGPLLFELDEFDSSSSSWRPSTRQNHVDTLSQMEFNFENTGDEVYQETTEQLPDTLSLRLNGEGQCEYECVRTEGAATTIKSRINSVIKRLCPFFLFRGLRMLLVGVVLLLTGIGVYTLVVEIYHTSTESVETTFYNTLNNIVITSNDSNVSEIARIGYAVEMTYNSLSMKGKQHVNNTKVPSPWCNMAEEETCHSENINDTAHQMLNGTCNNLLHPNWGSVYQPYRRLFSPNYTDGISAIRYELPSPQEVSLKIHLAHSSNKIEIADEELTLMVAAWGEFIASDMFDTAIPAVCDGTEECIDDFFGGNETLSKHNVTLGVRHYPRAFPYANCHFGQPRQQFSRTTAYMDASQIYLSSAPLGTGKIDAHVFANLHDLFASQHNRLVDKLQIMHHNWTGPMLFEAARRVVIAQIQHITYKEFLPVLFDNSTLESEGLVLIDRDEHYQKYDPDMDPQISNEFIVAWGFLSSMSTSHPKFEAVEDWSQLVNQKAGKIGVDIYYDRGNGYDQSAYYIQMGRDFGLPSYVYALAKCTNNSKIFSQFSELESIWNEDVLNKVKKVYRSANDVDLFTGLLAEKPMKNGKLGPTLSCILAEQFNRLRLGDMFWYEENIREGHFEEEMLESLRRTTLAGLICENYEWTKQIRRHVMEAEGPHNPTVNCTELDKVEWLLWSRLETISDNIVANDNPHVYNYHHGD